MVAYLQGIGFEVPQPLDLHFEGSKGLKMALRHANPLDFFMDLVTPEVSKDSELFVTRYSASVAFRVTRLRQMSRSSQP